MLRATRRLLRPGGRTAFFVIHLPADLSTEDRRRAVAVGPATIATRSPSYGQLIRSAGFVEIEQIDVTATYRETLRSWQRHARLMEEELEATEPPGVFAERIEEQAAARAAADDGLLSRSLFIARRRG